MLFLKECRRIICSKIYLLFFAAVFFFSFFTQFWSDMGLSWQCYDPPQPGGDYGMTVIDDPEMLAQNATASLLTDFINNEYTTYPYGFIHTVHLKGNDKKKISMILEQLTGFSEPEGYAKEHFEFKTIYYGTDSEPFYEYIIPELDVLSRVTIDDFRTLMTEADSILGGGSQYAPAEIDSNFCLAPMSYEDALAEYNALIYDDKVTNGYARLFCDYHGIFMVLFPVFLIAVYLSADRRSKMEQLIFTRSISSPKLVLTRFAALVCAEMLPVLFTAVLANIRVKQFYATQELDWLAMFKYSLIWILPTVIAVTGVDMLLMGFLHPVAVVIVQFVYWFFSANMAGPDASFGIFTLTIRHNTCYDRQSFIDSLPVFTENRLFFTGLGILCALASVFVWKLRREGKLGEIRLLPKLPVHQSEA